MNKYSLTALTSVAAFFLSGCDPFASSYPSSRFLVCLQQPQQADDLRLFFAKHVIENGFLYHDMPILVDVPLHSSARGEPRPGYWEDIRLAAQVPGATTFMMANNASLYGHEVSIAIFASNIPEASRAFEADFSQALLIEWNAIPINPRVGLIPGVCDNLDEVAL
ncbi:hypothetical protein F1654_03420 [Alkalicaulis satelles]|uniref:Uncharacterized protein n=1 Tax=Alkalicaulis satelles TaxID=2609175 RepID=A0A5M6ZJQ6_9PROT|nr:hypothetical protein [Alkalicaulis satelles]KAA5805056.1 hypothetical protein F1654_03420 [Alkalicaulis satelles]